MDDVLCTLPSRQCKCFHSFIVADCSIRTCAFSVALIDQATGINGIDVADNPAEFLNTDI
jgi:hypothetical protein